MVALICSSASHTCEYLLFHLHVTLDIITHLFTNQFDGCSVQYQSKSLGLWGREGPEDRALWRDALLLESSPRCTLDLVFWLPIESKPWKLQLKFRDLAHVHLAKVSSLTFWPDKFLLFWQISEAFKIYFCYIYFIQNFSVCFHLSRADQFVQIGLSLRFFPFVIGVIAFFF